MRSPSELVVLLTLLLPTSWLAQAIDGAAYFRPGSYSTVGRSSRHLRHDAPFAPSPLLPADMLSAESKRKDSSRRYTSSKKTPFRPFASDEDDLSSEFSNEFSGAFNSHETDSREFTIGTQIRVQHPITLPKKPTSSSSSSSSSSSHVKTSKPHPSHGPHKSSSYSEFKESPAGPSKPRPSKFVQLYEPSEGFQVVPPSSPKGSGSSYGAYDADLDDYQPPSRGNKAGSGSSSSSASPGGSTSFERFKGIASKKQIEAYLEDQQKMLDEALKLQLLNDPKFHQYVLSKEKERRAREHQQFDSEEAAPNPPPSFRPGPGSGSGHGGAFNDNHARRRPQAAELKRPLKGKPPGKGKPNKPLPRRFRSAIVINV